MSDYDHAEVTAGLKAGDVVALLLPERVVTPDDPQEQAANDGPGSRKGPTETATAKNASGTTASTTSAAK